MYPLEFPLRVLAEEQKVAKKWVYDPFCGRGTTNFAARLRGMPSVGVDSSPVAVAIAKAKMVTVSAESVLQTATEILSDSIQPRDLPRGPFWNWAFGENTLFDICKFREEFLRDCGSPSRQVLRAILLGALHGPKCKGQPSHLSNQCPRTFAPKPAYAVKFWKRHKLRPKEVAVLPVVRRRAERYLTPSLPRAEGRVLHKDSREWFDGSLTGRFSWVITSPPYYGMRTYIPDQWLRHWFVGGDPEIEYLSRSADLRHSSPAVFSEQLKQVWSHAARMSKPNAQLVCRFGGIHDRHQDCIDILKASFRDSGWKLKTIRHAGTALDGRRQAKQFGKGQHRQLRAEYDAYARKVD